MYEKFSKLLQDYGVSAYKVSKETGISQSVFSEWKRGKSQPKLDKLRKIADFFNVPITYFTENSDESIKVEAHNEPIYLDDETRDIIDELRTRPEMKILFSVSKNVTKEDIEATVEILKRMQRIVNRLDYCIRYVPLPISVKGVTAMDSDGFYNIYINSRLSYEEQKKTIAHEMEHIVRGDFFSFDALEEVETM